MANGLLLMATFTMLINLTIFKRWPLDINYWPLANIFSSLSSIKNKSLAPTLLMENTIFENQVAIYKSVCHSAMGWHTIVRCPAAFGVFSLVRNHTTCVHIHKCQIRVIALTDETTAINLVQNSWIVAHQLHQ